MTSKVTPFHAQSQEIESESRQRSSKGELPLGPFDAEPMAGAHNRGKVSRYFGPPTDPSLDAHRDNDHRTRWEQRSRTERRFIIGAIVFVLGLYAVAMFGAAIVSALISVVRG